MPLTRPRLTHPPVRALAVCAGALVLAGSLAACGGDGDGNDGGGSAGGSGQKPSSQGQPTADPTGINPAPGDVDASTAPTATATAVPSGGPTAISSFPIPPGVTVKGPGPQDQSWQFDITTKNVAKVLAFYRKALPAAGYTVRNDVSHNEGASVVTYDIAFSGRATGFLVGDQSEDDVFVVVQGLPDDTPSPQSGVAGGGG